MVKQSLNTLQAGNFALSMYWTADGSGNVTATLASAMPQLAQGMRVLQVETVPGSPAPTNGYSIALKNSFGTDLMAGAMAAVSSTANQLWAATSASPPFVGDFSLAITGNAVANAQGTVVVYFGASALINSNAGSPGPQGPTGPTGATGPAGGGLPTGNYTFSQAAQGTLSAGVAKTFNISGPTSQLAGNGVSIVGLNGTDTGHYVYISGGTGTAEVVLIQGGTYVSGATNGTIIFTPANNHSGAWTIQSANAGIQEAIVALGAPGLVAMPNGSVSIYGPISVPSGGYRIVGAGQRATALNVDASFPLSVAGVFILQPVSTVSFAQLEQFAILFIQPDSTTIGAYTHWPPAVYAQGAAYFKLSNLITDSAWVSVDARSNGTGSTIEDCFISGFSFGMRFDTFGDTVRLSNVHNTAGIITATTNQTTAFSANAVGIDQAGAPLLISNLLSLANIVLRASAGVTNCSNVEFDANNGISQSGGTVTVSGGYWSGNAGRYFISLTGGFITVNGVPITANGASATPVVTIDGLNSTACIVASIFRAAADVPFISVSPTAGSGSNAVTITGNTLEPAGSSPAIHFVTGFYQGTVTGNHCLGTAFLQVDAQPASSGTALVVSGNDSSNGTITIPANSTRISIDASSLSSFGAAVASASSIAATGLMFHVTGTAAIATITFPASFVVGQITLIPDAVFTTGTGGNIAIASTAVVGKAMVMTYDPNTSKFYPSY